MKPERWLTIAGYGTWLVSALPTVFAIADGRLSSTHALVWGSAFTAFGAAFGLMCMTPPKPHICPIRVSLLAIQSVAGLTMVVAARDVFPAATLVIIAGQLDEVPSRVAGVWIAAQTIALGVMLLPFAQPLLIVGVTGAFGGFMLFAYTTTSLALRERRSREELARANRELHATRALLAETSRAEERLRISRDLHDALGHHLTALSLRLDVASRLSDGTAVEHVRQAHALTRLLLSDVRDVVGQLREDGRVDLVNAIRTIAAGSEGLTVHVEAPDALEITDRARAYTLLRSVQEIITNTSKHADATHLWIRLEPRDDGVALHARDDGKGSGPIREGHGLTGMRERFAEHAGHVEFTASHGGGFEVHGFMPIPQGAS